MRNTCGDCQHYGNGPVTGPICTKTKKPTSVLMVKDCFEARTSAPVTVTKVCNRCHRELPITEFHRNHTRKDGYQCQCKECQRELAHAMYVKREEAKQTQEPTETPTTKVCAKCHRELPVENFGHTKKNKNGLKSYCRDCENENCRKYRAKRYGQPKKERKPKTMDFPVINDLLPQPVPAISTFTDDALIAELRLRGWHGTITKDTVIL